MRKKTFLVIACILALGVGFLLWAPVNFGIKEEIDISSSIDNVASELTDLRNWKNWNPELNGHDSTAFIYSPVTFQVHSYLHAGDHLYTILEGNPAYTVIREETKGNSEYHSLYALPDSLGRSTRVIWIRALSPLRWIKEKLFPGKEMEAGLNHLKKFMEDPSQYYGFPIAKGPVEDTLVLTKTTIAGKNEQITALLGLYEEIRQYGVANHINVDQTPIATFSPAGPDSMRVSAGIPVIQKGPEKKGLFFLNMPKRGWMLKGNYEGPYSGLKALYRAMEKFITDKRLQKAALPYEKYLSGLPSPNSRDSLDMKIMLYYPVF